MPPMRLAAIEQDGGIGQPRPDIALRGDDPVAPLFPSFRPWLGTHCGGTINASGGPGSAAAMPPLLLVRAATPPALARHGRATRSGGMAAALQTQQPICIMT